MNPQLKRALVSLAALVEMLGIACLMAIRIGTKQWRQRLHKEWDYLCRLHEWNTADWLDQAIKAWIVASLFGIGFLMLYILWPYMEPRP